MKLVQTKTRKFYTVELSEIEVNTIQNALLIKVQQQKGYWPLNEKSSAQETLESFEELTKSQV